jgi:phosphoenolpyruvate---glycerone phosphotransferase subunit DhaL
MTEITIGDVELALRTVAGTALKNEQYFSELDAAAGDADFGVSLASGFRVVDKDFDTLDRSSIGNLLLKVSMIIARNVGGCSGPIWGTGFMRAAALCRDRSTISLQDLEKMLTAAIDGIQQRGGAQRGDKTLLDALMPIRDMVSERAADPDASPAEVLREAARIANNAIEETVDWVAKRGRQSFTGDRSKGTKDPGIVAIATMLDDLCEAFGVNDTAGAKAAS